MKAINTKNVAGAAKARKTSKKIAPNNGGDPRHFIEVLVSEAASAYDYHDIVARSEKINDPALLQWIIRKLASYCVANREYLDDEVHDDIAAIRRDLLMMSTRASNARNSVAAMASDFESLSRTVTRWSTDLDAVLDADFLNSSGA